MAGSRLSPSLVRWSSGLLASVAMVAALTGVVTLLERHVPVLSLLVLYLLAVLVVAIFWGSRLAALTAVGSVAPFAFFILPPRGSLDIADPRNLTALGVFLVTAVVVGELAARSRRAAFESAHLSREQSALRRVATLIAQSAPLATIRNRRWRPEPSSAEAGFLLINHSSWTAKDSMMTASRPPRGHGGMAREAVADGHRQFVPTILP